MALLIVQSEKNDRKIIDRYCMIFYNIVKIVSGVLNTSDYCTLDQMLEVFRG